MTLSKHNQWLFYMFWSAELNSCWKCVVCFHNNVWNITLQHYDRFEMNIMSIKYPKAFVKICNRCFKAQFKMWNLCRKKRQQWKIPVCHISVSGVNQDSIYRTKEAPSGHFIPFWPQHHFMQPWNSHKMQPWRCKIWKGRMMGRR